MKLASTPPARRNARLVRGVASMSPETKMPLAVTYSAPMVATKETYDFPAPIR